MTIDNKSKHSTSPSTEINQIFTPLIHSYATNISKQRALGWNFPLLPQRVLGSIKTSTATELTGYFDKSSGLFDRANKTVSVLDMGIEFAASVGEYGEVWAKRLICAGITLATSAISESSPVNILNKTEQVNSESAIPLNRFTFNKTYEDKRLSQLRGPNMTIREAFQSTLFAVGLLTMYSIPGYENNPDQLVQELVKDGVVSHLALILPPGATAALGENGTVFKPPVVAKGSHGRFILDPAIINHFHQGRKPGSYYSDSKTTGAEEPLERPGCPVARVLPGNDTSGVDIAAQLFTDCLEAQKRLVTGNNRRTYPS